MRTQSWLIGLLLASACVVMMSCSGAVRETGEADDAVRLVVLQDRADFNEEQFERWIAEPVRRKHPHLSMDFRVNIGGSQELQYLISKGQFPDIVLTSLSGILEHRSLQTAQNLVPLISHHRFALEPFYQTALAAIRNGSGEDELYALPLSIDFHALFYNQDLFNERQREAPVDGMTWEEVIALSKSFGRHGLASPGIPVLASQYALPYTSERTGRADIHTDEWIRVLQVNHAIKTIEHNKKASNALFVEWRNTGMMASSSRRLADLENAHERGLAMNWDLVQYPSYPERMDVGPGVSGHFMLISTFSKHQEEAFRVLSVVTGVENQLEMARSGIPSAWDDSRMSENFAQDHALWPGKHYEGAFKSRPAEPYRMTLYDPSVIPALLEASQRLADGVEDVNTIFRIAQEMADQQIEERKKGF